MLGCLASIWEICPQDRSLERKKRGKYFWQPGRIGALFVMKLIRKPVSATASAALRVYEGSSPPIQANTSIGLPRFGLEKSLGTRNFRMEFSRSKGVGESAVSQPVAAEHVRSGESADVAP